MEESEFYEIEFEDKGQDFLEFIVKRNGQPSNGGVIVDCQPFQGRIWIGKTISVSNRNCALGLDGRTVMIHDEVTDSFRPMKYKIKEIRKPNEDYVQGWNDVTDQCVDEDYLRSTDMYMFGVNVHRNFLRYIKE